MRVLPSLRMRCSRRRVRMPELPTPAFVRSIVIAAALLAIPLFAALGRELGLRRSSARLAACVIATSVAIVTYTTISMTPLLLLPTAVIW